MSAAGRVCAAVVLCVLASVGCAGPSAQPPSSAPSSVAPTVVPAVAPTPVAGHPRSEPTEVHIPRIDARSSLIPLGLNTDGTSEVPPVERPMQAGWYVNAPTPGELGPAVILGHVDGNRMAGIFHRLHELVAGDRVTVSRADGSVLAFVVLRVEQIPKDRFPTEAVYGDTDRPQLRLITCGGDFDRSARSYRDNIIVYAALA